MAGACTPHICHNRWLSKKKLAKCKIFQLECEKMLYTRCKILHTLYNCIHSFVTKLHFQVWNFLSSNCSIVINDKYEVWAGVIIARSEWIQIYVVHRYQLYQGIPFQYVQVWGKRTLCMIVLQTSSSTHWNCNDNHVAIVHSPMQAF